MIGVSSADKLVRVGVLRIGRPGFWVASGAVLSFPSGVLGGFYTQALGFGFATLLQIGSLSCSVQGPQM